MKKTMILISLTLVLIFAGITGYAVGDSKKGYNGFTIYYDAESNKGFVYVNQNPSSALMVSYPSSNQTFLYSSNGQEVLNTDALLRIMSHPDSAVISSTIAVIIPASEFNK